MRSYRLLLAAFLALGIFFSTDLSAQDEREDVVYLKNGNIYRGMIIEQVPGVSIKVETIGGNVFTVAISDILKTTREKKPEAPAPPAGPQGGDMHGERYYPGYHDYRDHHHMHNDSLGRTQYHPRNRGYFNTAQLLIDNLEGGGRLVNGYKFSRLGYLGIGIGVDFVFNDLSRNNQAYSGVYLPLYLSYSGDILKKRITPYYSIEAGYAVRMNPDHNNNIVNFPNQNFFENSAGASSVRGGLMGGLGFGAKFHTRHRVFFSLSAQADFQRASNKYVNYYAPNGLFYPEYRTSTTLLIPGIRFGIGF